MDSCIGSTDRDYLESIEKRDFFKTHNCQSIPLSRIPLLKIDDFRSTLISAMLEGCSMSAFFASPYNENTFKITAVLSDRAESALKIGSTFFKKDDTWHSLSKQVPSIQLFEREMAEQWGIAIENHPWLKPVRYQQSYTSAKKENIQPAVTDFYQITGEQIHEVAVGPVHAGIIEPGHFRFQCHGENVFHLEIALGFQHRGIEKHLLGSPNNKLIYYIENTAGDTAIAHSVSYCQSMEGLSGCFISPRAEAIRAIALELERLANHTGDLGALAQDVGFLPTSSYCGRLRGDFLNMTALICGSRFGRSLVKPGGVNFDIDDQRASELTKRLNATAKDVENAVSLLWESPSVLSRFDGTGTVTKAVARDIGLVGVAARASDLPCDVRQDFPDGIYQFFHIPMSTWHTGDVFARAYVRWLEIQHSVAFINELLKALPAGSIKNSVGELSPCSQIVTLVEGWRGEICHTVQTDERGKIVHYKIVDPSFHNWPGLAVALRNQEISDFPICNKSFNLSYCGFDL